MQNFSSHFISFPFLKIRSGGGKTQYNGKNDQKLIAMPNLVVTIKQQKETCLQDISIGKNCYNKGKECILSDSCLVSTLPSMICYHKVLKEEAIFMYQTSHQMLNLSCNVPL